MDKQLRILQAVHDLHDNAYGVTIYEALERQGRDRSLGTIYTTMEHMERAGLVTSHLQVGGPERGGRVRVLWTLTDKGRALLGEEG